MYFMFGATLSAILYLLWQNWGGFLLWLITIPLGVIAFYCIWAGWAILRTGISVFGGKERLDHKDEYQPAEAALMEQALHKMDPALLELAREIGVGTISKERYGPLRDIILTEGCFRTGISIQPKGRALADGFRLDVSVDNYHDDYMLASTGFFDFQKRCIVNKFRGVQQRYAFKVLDDDFKIPESLDEQREVLANAWREACALRDDFDNLSLSV